MGRGCSLALAEFSVEARMEGVLPPHSEPHGQFSGWTPSVQHTGTSQNAPDWTLSPAQAPSTIPAGREGCPLPRP